MQISTCEKLKQMNVLPFLLGKCLKSLIHYKDKIENKFDLKIVDSISVSQLIDLSSNCSSSTAVEI